MTGRPRTCDCGTCRKCKRRDAARLRYQLLTPEQRREFIARRDKEAVRAADRARYYRHRTTRLERMKDWARQHPERARQHRENWLEQNPEKRAAQIKVGNAIRDGRLVRLRCEVCGGKAQAHHDDYSKPFDVRWLCSTHHGEVHRRYEAA